MALPAQTLVHDAAAFFYDALANRDTLLSLVGIYAGTLTAQQAVTGAASKNYHALSEHDLMLCILEALSP